MHLIVFSPVPSDRGATWCREILGSYTAGDFLFSATFFLPVSLGRLKNFSQIPSDSQHTSLVDFADALEKYASELELKQMRGKVRSAEGADYDT